MYSIDMQKEITNYGIFHVVVQRRGFFGRKKRVVVDQWCVKQPNSQTTIRIREHMEHEGMTEDFEIVEVKR